MNLKPLLFSLLLLPVGQTALAQRSVKSLNEGWKFAFGSASSMEKDFTHGTEYFTYLAKAGTANHDRSPAWVQFNDSAWRQVNLPFDWVVDLPFDSLASHSHGYKQVGWRYPENSVGWYRRHFTIDKSADGQRIFVRFDGIFRNSQVFCNGFYLGGEPSGYATQRYELTDYLNYGGDNVLTVRADASTEEGWYYEGAGIYRDVWLETVPERHFLYEGLCVSADYVGGKGVLSLSAKNNAPGYRHHYILKDAAGKTVSEIDNDGKTTLSGINPWSASIPYLYRLTAQLVDPQGNVVDAQTVKVGFRHFDFDPKRGFMVNGVADKLRGVNLHQDHAGVGTGIPDELWVYRLQRLKQLGVNAIRSSHNPATPAMLDICDSMGFYVIDENRLMGINDYHLSELKKMVMRDRNHPSVMLWSIGNEEWQIESGEKGERIARRMQDYVHELDSTRLCTYGNSGGFGIVKVTDVHGYNYIVQNDVEHRRQVYPDWFVIGTEETSGCGTRNVYVTDQQQGWMAPINYVGEERSNGEKNVIARGWHYYRDHIFAGGLFYWTGFDYRGEPNPMKWPSTGSEFGLLDYCGFPKDEAYYLQAAWTERPTLHLFPHWNLRGHEGERVALWAYTNMDEVELFVNGKSQGRKRPADRDSYLEWDVKYQPGEVKAVGYRNGKRTVTTTMAATGTAVRASVVKTKKGRLTVYDITLVDKKGREVPDACQTLQVNCAQGTEVLGWGNGDPAFKTEERPDGSAASHYLIPAFMGKAQLIVRDDKGVDIDLAK